MMAQGKKRGKGIVVVLILLLVVAAAAVFVGMPYLEEYKAKEATYNEAMELMEAQNYRDAYNLFLQVSDHKDADEQAQQAEEALRELADSMHQQAKALADLGFNMMAGLYLTEELETTDVFTTKIYNETVALIEDYYAASQTLCDEIMAVDEKLPMIPMQQFFADLQELGERKDTEEALRILEGITSHPLFIQLFQKCWDEGYFAECSLVELAEGCPQWVPIMDKIIAGTENLDVMALIAQQ